MKKKKFIKKLPAWKVKSFQKRQTKLKEILLRIFTLVVFFGLISIIFFISNLFKNSLWDGKNQINLIIHDTNQGVLFYSFHPREKVLNIIVFAADTHIPVAGGFGEYPIGNIVKLGDLEKVGGGELLRLSLQEFLAVPVEGVIVNQPDKAGNPSFNAWLYSWCRFKKSCTTNLANWDLFRLGIELKQFHAGQIKKIDFASTEFIEAKVLPDGTTISKPNYLKIDGLSLEYLSDLAVIKENLTVKVFNGTRKPGFADHVGRLLKNMGLKLINTSDLGEERQKSVLRYKNQEAKESLACQRLQKTFPYLEIEEKQDMEEDLSLILGDNFNLLH